MHHPFSFEGYQGESLKLVSQQNRAWSDCTDVQAGLALFWWPRLITFGFSRIRVTANHFHLKQDEGFKEDSLLFIINQFDK